MDSGCINQNFACGKGVLFQVPARWWNMIQAPKLRLLDQREIWGSSYKAINLECQCRSLLDDVALRCREKVEQGLRVYFCSPVCRHPCYDNTMISVKWMKRFTRCQCQSENGLSLSIWQVYHFKDKENVIAISIRSFLMLELPTIQLSDVILYHAGFTGTNGKINNQHTNKRVSPASTPVFKAC